MRKELGILAAVCLFVSCGGEKPEPEPVNPVPATPTGLVLHGATETSLTFQWDAMQYATSYEWELKQGNQSVKNGTADGKRNVTISGLTKATDYKFGVKAVNGNGSSSVTWIDARTDGTVDPDPPTPPTPPSGQYYEQFSIPEAEEDGVARAFPGAEGGGMYTTGGRGGEVIHVTTLEDTGSKGSLRWAVNQSGARTVVFDVAGIIELQSDLKISRGDLTIAGQTAPGDGICLKNYTVNLAASNIIIRFMRFRLGDEAPWTSADIAAGKADGEDCIWGRYLDNVILDHCSMSWSVDEAASFYANEYFTLQWCLIAESMKDCKLHTKGNHGYGGLWGGKNASFHHNILAHHDSRNARIDHPHIYQDHKNPARRGNVDLRNNVIYDWGDNSTYGGEGGHFNLVNNYYKKGPSSKDRKYFVDAYGVYSNCSTCNESNIDHGYPDLYLAGNVYSQYPSMANGPGGVFWHNGSGHGNYNKTASAPLVLVGREGKDAYTTTHTAEKALDAACNYAGASLAKDAVDIRISKDVKDGTGSLIKDIADVKSKYGSAWPTYSATDEQKAKIQDSDQDGMPDWFEEQFGLNKNDKPEKNDASLITLDKNGRYTNLEMYLHYLVKDIVAGQNAGGSYMKL